ncbi:MAG: ribbon-helix-helix protein, CopG family [Planctomycetes bacterium]|nr:ribbon-helix-helix protein, CopG family [Planctomycetota bacterium]
MKTTLNIDATVMARLKREAARQGRTMSELVESALRLFFKGTRDRRRLQDLPRFKSGGALVDISNRDDLYRAMEGR